MPEVWALQENNINSMKYTEVTVTFKRTVQMRQFEPAEISVTVRAQVDPGENPSRVIHDARKTARNEVEAERSRLLDERLEAHEKEKSQ